MAGLLKESQPEPPYAYNYVRYQNDIAFDMLPSAITRGHGWLASEYKLFDPSWVGAGAGVSDAGRFSHEGNKIEIGTYEGFSTDIMDVLRAMSGKSSETSRGALERVRTETAQIMANRLRLKVEVYVGSKIIMVLPQDSFSPSSPGA